MSDFDSMRLTKAGNGVRGSVVFTGTVWSELDAYDRLPAQVRAAMRNLKIPISPGEVDQALRSGASVAETLRDLRANDAHLMTFGVRIRKVQAAEMLMEKLQRRPTFFGDEI